MPGEPCFIGRVFSVTLVVHEHKRLGRGIELATLAEQLRAAGTGLEFLTGKKKGRHPSPATVLRLLRDHDQRATTPQAPAAAP